MASVFLALPMVLSIALFTPGDAAASAKNRTTVNLLPGAAKSLGANHLRLVSTGLARGRGAQVRVPVRAGSIGLRRANLAQAGGFDIRARVPGRRKAGRLHIGRLQLKLGPRSVLVGRPRGIRRQVTLFVVRHGPRALSLNRRAKTAILRSGRLVPTAAMRRILRSRLGFRKARAVPIARLSARADLKEFELPPITPPPLKPLPPEPEKLPRPAGAVDVTGAIVTWCVRASWIRYIGNGVVSNGATREQPFVVNDPFDPRVCDRYGEQPDAKPPKPPKNVKVTSAATAYRYGFAFKEGWYDPGTQKAALYFTGRVGFKYAERGIDLDFNDPEVEINGASTRLIFRMEGRGGTAIASHRAVFTENGDPVPALTTAPGTVKTPQMQGWLSTASEHGVFAEFYLPPNHDFGWVSVEFNIP